MMNLKLKLLVSGRRLVIFKLRFLVLYRHIELKVWLMEINTSIKLKSKLVAPY